MANDIEKTVAALQAILDPTDRVNKTISKSWDGQPWLDNVKRIKCADGFSVSMQASHSHYCSPRDSKGPWSAVELGFPNRRVPEWIDWREAAPDTKTVFGYVPIEKVAEVVIKHGGLVP